jgi:pimeloyl-ACP methyl ester carboxylesterase
MVMASDEAGVITWHFAAPEIEKPEQSNRSTSGTRTYLIPRSPAPVPENPAAASRSLVVTVGKKVFKVLAFKLLDPLIGAAGNYFAGQWEDSHRPYRLRTFTPDDYLRNAGAPLPDSFWSEVGKGPALLMIHGTFSTTAAAFGDLPADYVRQLHERYRGRVFAFDHYTLSHDPVQNVERFFSAIPESVRTTLDIVCHSRGGLVARTLAERQDLFNLGPREVSVRSIIFVAAPNNGTILADAKYMGDFIDSYTNLLNFFPTNGATEILDGVITVVKQLAVGTLKGLSGLQSMRKGGTFLSELNRAATPTENYFAIASNFDPAEAGIKEWATNRLLDKIFKEENDLVVPTSGVYQTNGSGYFPIQTKELFQAGDHIAHTRFFGNSRVQNKIMEWLGGLPRDVS